MKVIVTKVRGGTSSGQPPSPFRRFFGGAPLGAPFFPHNNREVLI